MRPVKRDPARPAFLDASRPGPGPALNLPIRAVTPIYKGGAGANQFDEGRPFRAPAIKGLLRWWWRATWPCADWKALWEAERLRFGGVHGDEPAASRLRVGVTNQKSEKSASFEQLHAGSRLTYALWPATMPKGREKETQFHVGAEGTLHVAWERLGGALPADRAGEELRRALGAWLLFGGVGSRTRRGLGKVDSSTRGKVLRQRDPDTPEKLLEALCWLAPSQGPAPDDGWPTLRGARLLILDGGAEPEAEPAWRAAVEAVQRVRAPQGAALASGEAWTCPPTREDLCRFPGVEREAIRKGQSFRSPRSALGLPLQFEGGRYAIEHETCNRVPGTAWSIPVRLGSWWYPVILVWRGPWPRERSLKTTKGVRGEMEVGGLDAFVKRVQRLRGWTLLGGAE